MTHAVPPSDEKFPLSKNARLAVRQIVAAVRPIAA